MSVEIIPKLSEDQKKILRQYTDEFIATGHSSKGEYEAVIKGSHYIYTVSMINKKINGIAAITESEKQLWLTFIYVDKQYRRRKIGTNILWRIKQYMKEFSYTKLRVGVDLKNEVSNAFFKSFKDLYLVKELKI